MDDGGAPVPPFYSYLGDKRIKDVCVDDFFRRGLDDDRNLEDFVVSELVVLQNYHAHLLRSILDYFAKTIYLEIPAFMLPQFLPSSCQLDLASSRLAHLLGSGLQEDGTPFAIIVDRARYLQVMAFPTPLYPDATSQDLEDDGILESLADVQDKLAQCIWNFFLNIRLPNKFSNGYRGIGIHGWWDIIGDTDEIGYLSGICSSFSVHPPRELHIVESMIPAPTHCGLIMALSRIFVSDWILRV